MPISGCHDLPLATFNLPWSTHARHRSNLQRKKQHRHSGIFRVADLGPGTMPRGKYPESPAPAGSHALISRTPTPGGMLHANLGLPRPPPRNFQPPLPQRLPIQPQKNPHPPRRLGGGFNPLRGATTGVVIRRRATSGEMARGGVVIVIPDIIPRQRN